MAKIEWTDRSDWNPIRGCTRVSAGCENCYAEAIAARFSDEGQPFHGYAKRTSKGPRWTGKVGLIEDHLTLPLRWRKPARVFVNSMSDVFHEDVPDEWIDCVFAVMALAPKHTFQVLTKRPERMRSYFEDRREGDPWAEAADHIADLAGIEEHPVVLEPRDIPLPNVWLGTSCEDQATADERIPHLLATPAAVRFVSLEPLLGPIDLVHLRPSGAVPHETWNCLFSGIRWVILGGESGPRARTSRIDWHRSIIQQCRAAGVPVFEKQAGRLMRMSRSDAVQPCALGAGWRSEPGADDGVVEFVNRKGGDPMEWPPDLRVREMPS